MKHGFFTAPVQSCLLAAVQCYRLLFRAWIGPVCRFEPSCSAYAIEALKNHGAAAGSYLTLRRLARCHPWCEGGHDPVPPLRTQRGLFSGFSYSPCGGGMVPEAGEKGTELASPGSEKKAAGAAFRLSSSLEKTSP
jgi:hypothetical protein